MVFVKTNKTKKRTPKNNIAKKNWCPVPSRHWSGSQHHTTHGLGPVPPHQDELSRSEWLKNQVLWHPPEDPQN